MSHVVEVDQSGRVEYTAEDTVLAFANGMQFSVLITSVTKRVCVRALREAGLGGNTLYTQLFATCLFFLLRNYIHELSTVIVDIEFIGKDSQIKEHLYTLLGRVGQTPEREQVQFRRVGKKSPAHELAINTLRRRNEPNLIIDVEQILEQFRKGRKARRANKERGKRH
jgi:hypothetical protein